MKRISAVAAAAALLLLGCGDQTTTTEPSEWTDEQAELCVEDEVLAYAPERPDEPICVHVEGDGARFFRSDS